MQFVRECLSYGTLRYKVQKPSRKRETAENQNSDVVAKSCRWFIEEEEEEEEEEHEAQWTFTFRIPRKSMIPVFVSNTMYGTCMSLMRTRILHVQLYIWTYSTYGEG
jgi:hypothetical protein